MKKILIFILFLFTMLSYGQEYVTPVDGIYEVKWMTINNERMNVPLMVVGVEKESNTVVVLVDIDRNRSFDNDTEKYYQGKWNDDGYISFTYENAKHFIWCEINNGQQRYYWLTQMPGQEVLCEIFYKGQWSW